MQHFHLLSNDSLHQNEQNINRKNRTKYEKHVDKVCTWCYIENVQSTKEVSTW
jgi:hypothetical protein